MSRCGALCASSSDLPRVDARFYPDWTRWSSRAYQILKADEKMHGHFCNIAAKLLGPIAAKVGWEPREDDGHTGKLLRATVVELLAA